MGAKPVNQPSGDDVGGAGGWRLRRWLVWALIAFSIVMAGLIVHAGVRILTAPPPSYMMSPLEPYGVVAAMVLVWVVGAAMLAAAIFLADAKDLTKVRDDARN